MVHQSMDIIDSPPQSSSTFVGKLRAKVVEMAKNVLKMGKEDPRRIVHSFKVGIALTINSLFYYCNSLYDSFETSGIWAILTVVVVFEFTVGATLSKGLNRGFATLVAAGMGVGAKYLADLCGEKGEPIVLGALVFILAGVLTFARFAPRIKKKYDYGVLIFILTFSMVAVSGYRSEEIIEVARHRFLTVVIAGGTCILISIILCPAWAGQDLQNLIAANLEKLGLSIEGFGSSYFRFPEGEGRAAQSDNSFAQHHRSVLNSKASEESLANFAWWEIGHGEFRFRHPWKHYLKVGALARECASHLEALCGYLNTNDQASMKFKRRIEETCKRMCFESSKALKGLSLTIKTMTLPSKTTLAHLLNSRAAINDLEIAVRSSTTTSLSMEDQLLQILPCLAVTSILIDITNSVNGISKLVVELSEKAHFKKPATRTTTMTKVAVSSSSSPSHHQQQRQQQQETQSHAPLRWNRERSFGRTETSTKKDHLQERAVL
ncbi:hypothetical protein DM860_010463 [Cuscuta australis]|uniref:Aluminum-activated malate transporter n=1 Tax=Cuscuta australis TaxID=267555 RepID=A0A328E190_9ASTE|nr:hypothetical protein DM860_010463 [Cuscuta australis]